MQAEVISIGDELTSGLRLDTNSCWLSEQLGTLGVRTLFHTTVADDLQANVAAFRQAASRVDFVIATGGLGPTADDLTRAALSAAFNKPLELDEPSLKHIESMFRQRDREMPAQNRVQAMIPHGSLVIPNPHGTAPGIDLTVPGSVGTCRLFALPGVPAEMKEMWFGTVRTALQAAMSDQMQVVRHYRIKCFGRGESDVEAMLPDLIRRGREPTVGITVSKATITLRITAAAENEQACWDQIRPTADTIRAHLGELVFGQEDDELHHVVARELVARRLSCAVAESATGGLVAAWLTDVAGVEAWFRGGVFLPTASQAAAVLGVATTLSLEQHIEAVASAVRQSFGADIGLAVGPLPSNPQDPRATIVLGLSSAEGVFSVKRGYAAHPDIVKARTAKQALDLLRLHLVHR